MVGIFKPSYDALEKFLHFAKPLLPLLSRTSKIPKDMKQLIHGSLPSAPCIPCLTGITREKKSNSPSKDKTLGARPRFQILLVQGRHNATLELTMTVEASLPTTDSVERGW
jgi:hypothetical protein